MKILLIFIKIAEININIELLLRNNKNEPMKGKYLQ